MTINQNNHNWRGEFRNKWEGGNALSTHISLSTKVMDEIIKDIEQTINKEVNKVLDRIDQDDCGEENEIRAKIKKQLLASLQPTNNTILEKILEEHPDITSDKVYKNGFVSNNTKEE